MSILQNYTIPLAILIVRETSSYKRFTHLKQKEKTKVNLSDITQFFFIIIIKRRLIVILMKLIYFLESHT